MLRVYVDIFTDVPQYGERVIVLHALLTVTKMCTCVELRLCTIFNYCVGNA